MTSREVGRGAGGLGLLPCPSPGLWAGGAGWRTGGRRGGGWGGGGVRRRPAGGAAGGQVRLRCRHPAVSAAPLVAAVAPPWVRVWLPAVVRRCVVSVPTPPWPSVRRGG